MRAYRIYCQSFYNIGIKNSKDEVAYFKNVAEKSNVKITKFSNDLMGPCWFIETDNEIKKEFDSHDLFDDITEIYFQSRTETELTATIPIVMNGKEFKEYLDKEYSYGLKKK